MKKAILTVLTCIFLLSSVGVAGAEQELQLLFTHDLHSYIDVTHYNVDGQAVERGGFAKIKSLIDAAKAEGDPLVVDGGDFSMGTLYQSVFAEEGIELRLLGLMGYDATTFGNHEFDYGSDGLASMLRAAKASGDQLPLLLSNNIDWAGSPGSYTKELQAACQDYGVLPATILEKGGVKVGLFGLMGEQADAYAPASGLAFMPAAERAKATVAELKAEGADIIVCLSHSGTDENPKKSEDQLLARAVPEIDVIVSGHTHTVLEEPIIEGNTAIVSCGCYGQYLGDMTLRRSDDRWQVADFALIPIDNSVVEETSFATRIGEYKGLIKPYLELFGYSDYDEVLAKSPFNFADQESMNASVQEQPLGNLIADSYIHAVSLAEGERYEPIAAAVVPIGVVRGAFVEGDITVAQAYEVSSLGIGYDRVPGYPLVSVYITGEEMRTMAEISASVSQLMAEVQLYFNGFGYTYNPHRLLLNRVTDSWLIDQEGERKEIDDEALYRVVADLYSGQMLGAVESESFGLLSIVPKDKDGNPIEDLSTAVIAEADGTELKAWYALASYLQSFEAVDGVPTIPAYYGETHGRVIVDDDASLFARLKSPNKIFWMVAGAIVLVVAIIVLLVCLIVRLVRKGKRCRAAAVK